MAKMCTVRLDAPSYTEGVIAVTDLAAGITLGSLCVYRSESSDSYKSSSGNLTSSNRSATLYSNARSTVQVMVWVLTYQNSIIASATLRGPTSGTYQITWATLASNSNGQVGNNVTFDVYDSLEITANFSSAYLVTMRKTNSPTATYNLTTSNQTISMMPSGVYRIDNTNPISSYIPK